jgi:hypothetical protein
MPKDIIVRNPQVNHDFFRDHSHDDPKTRRDLIQQLGALGSNLSDRYPYIAVLYAGNAGETEILTREFGWPPGNITCFDISRPSDSFVKGLNWEFWNLNVLDNRLREGSRLPEEVEVYRARFDMVLKMFGSYGFHGRLMDFFLNENGLVYYYPFSHSQIQRNQQKWEPYSAGSFLIRRTGGRY